MESPSFSSWKVYPEAFSPRPTDERFPCELLGFTAEPAAWGRLENSGNGATADVSRPGQHLLIRSPQRRLWFGYFSPDPGATHFIHPTDRKSPRSNSSQRPCPMRCPTESPGASTANSPPRAPVSEGGGRWTGKGPDLCLELGVNRVGLGGHGP